MLPSPSDKKAVINFFVIKSVLGGLALSMVGVKEGREFRFRGDLYSQESTFPLVFIMFRAEVRALQCLSARFSAFDCVLV